MWQAAGLLRAEQGEPLTFTDAEEAIMAAPSAGPDTGTLAALRQGTRASISRICRLEQVRRGILRVSVCLLPGHSEGFLHISSSYRSVDWHEEILAVLHIVPSAGPKREQCVLVWVWNSGTTGPPLVRQSCRT